MPSRQKKSKKKAGRRPLQTRNLRRRVAIVGAGRLGTALGRALSAEGYKIDLVVARNLAHAKKAARTIGGDVVYLAASELSRMNSTQSARFFRVDLILITTADDAISAVTRQLSNLFGLRISKTKSGAKRVALHSSGALSSEILRSLRTRGFAVGSLHPLVSISDRRKAIGNFSGAYFSIEGDARALTAAREIVRSLRGQSFTLNAKMKPLYHAAAVMASGHLVALLDVAIEMLARCGLRSRDAQKVLLPLMQSALANLTSKDPPHALTGPFARADLTTLQNHLKALKSPDLNDARNLYLLLGQRSLQLARQAGLKPADLAAVERLLKTARAPNRDK
jgi:predicted short-subunit dehydrogenase-like oxidoreductase (DUF2520 family)